MWRITKETMKKFLNKFIGRYKILAEIAVYLVLGVISAGCIYCIHKGYGMAVTVIASALIACCLYVAALTEYVSEELTKKGEHGDKE